MYESYENYGSSMDQTARTISAIHSLVLGKELSGSELLAIKSIQCVQDFLDADSGSKIETDVKKLFAQAIIVASEKGINPLGLPEGISAEQVVSLVDDGLTRVKTAYQLGKDLIDVYQADEINMEHLAARVETFAEVALEQGIALADMAIDGLEQQAHSKADFLLDHSDMFITAIEKAYPPAIPVAEFCRVVVNYTKPVIKEYVHQGIAKVGQLAKDTVRSAVEKIPSLFQKAKQYLLA